MANFDGTSQSAAHIGVKASANLNAALTAGSEPVKALLSIGAEAANVIKFNLQLQDRRGKNLAETARLHVRLFTAAMIEIVVGAFTLTQATGAFVSTDAQSAAILDTASDGSAIIDVTDVVGATGATIYAVVDFLEREGPSQMIAITFD